MTGIEFMIAVAIFIPVVWQLEATHRRTRGLPRIPFGADAESEAAASYRRQVAELRQLSQLAAAGGRTPKASPAGQSEIDPRVHRADLIAQR